MGRWPLAASRPRIVDYARCGNSSMRPPCDSSRLGTETFQEKSARLLHRSSSAWQCSSCALLWFLSPLFNRRSTGCDSMIKCRSNASHFLRSFRIACRPGVTVLPLKTSGSSMMDVVKSRPSDTGVNYERAGETSMLTPVNHFYGGTASL